MKRLIFVICELSIVFGNGLQVEMEYKFSFGSYSAKAMSEVIESVYQGRSNQVYIFNTVDTFNRSSYDDVANGILRNIESFKMTIQFEDYQKMKPRRRLLVIILIDSYEDFLKFSSKLSSENFDFRGYFTIVTLNPIEIDDLQKIINFFWQAPVTNVYIIIPSKKEKLQLFTFNPFNGIKCGDTTPVKINDFDKDRMTWQIKPVHSNKLGNLQECQIFIGEAAGTSEPYAMFKNDGNGKLQFVGIENDILVEISKILNFQVKFHIADMFGALYENGTATGMLVDWL